MFEVEPMKYLKKLLPGLLCALAICILLPFRAEAATYTGSCGANVTWKVDTSTGVLSVTGTGAMNDYTYSTRFWRNYSDYIKSVVVGEGITYIGKCAFDLCPATSVSLPSTLTELGEMAFYGCDATTLTFPAKLTTIGEDALGYMEQLTAIYVDEGNTRYSSRDGILFKDTTLVMCPQNTQLTSYAVPEDITYIGDHAFRDCANLTEVTLHDGLERIGKCAFMSCTGLTEVTIPAGVDYLGAQAFDYCSNLKTITFLNLIRLTIAWTGESQRSSEYFNGCASPLTIRAYDCAGYSIWYDPGYGSWKEYVEDYATPSIKLAYQSLGYAGGKLKNGTWLLDGKGVLTVNATGAVTEDPWDSYYSMVKKAVFSEGITAIPSFSGYSYSQMTSVSLPSTLQSLPNYAFYKSTALKEITIPASVTSLGKECFYQCENLTSVTLPEGITAIPDYAFYDCRKLTSLNIPSGVTSIGKYAFWACLQLPDMALPAGLESIGREGFSNCTAFTSVTLPATLTDLGEGAFVCCTDLQAITVEAGNPAFAAVDGILYTKDGKTLFCYPDAKAGDAFTVPSTVTAIAPYAFYCNQNLTSLTLHGDIGKIGTSAVGYPDKLTDVYYDGTETDWAAVEVADYVFDKKVVIHFGLACKTAGTALVGYVAVTCTENGYTGDTVCNGCGALVAKGKTVTSSGHATVWHSAKNPTCTAVGWYGYYTCKNCDYTTYRERPMLSHTITHVLQAATCTADGQEYWQCTSCKGYFTDETGTEAGQITVLPSAGHGWSEWQTVTAPTWLEAGEETRSCGTCGETETNILSATGQAVADGITVTVTDGKVTAQDVPDGLTLLFAVYENGRLTAAAQGVLILPAGGDRLLVFFVDSHFRPIAAARPVAW